MAGGRRSDHPRVPDPSTLEPVTGTAVPSVARVVALTVLFHPRIERVGERALIGGLSRLDAEVSRLSPRFSREGEGAPLEDGYVSRKPLRLVGEGAAGVRLDASETSMTVRVEGAPLAGVCRIEARALERGVALELADRVVLLLHSVGASHGRPPDHGLAGTSAAIDAVRLDIGRAAQEDVPVLLRGESGVGKELVAQAIHRSSARAAGPYIAVNMAAIPAATAPADLFGHERGAYTGAGAPHGGYFGAAEGGTLFLDEIGEASAEVQPMLLRALEAGEVQPVGAQRTRRVDVRVVAATESDLEAAVRAGRFRLPLLHRLAGYEVRIPPLRERREDIAVLMLEFLRRELARVGGEERLADPGPGKPTWLTTSLLTRATQLAWEGNARQLRNFCRQLAIACRDLSVVELPAALEHMLAGGSEAGAGVGVASEVSSERRPIDEATLVEALRRNGWQVAPTARELGVAKNTLYRLMERCDRIRKAGDLAPAEIVEARARCGGDVERMAELLEVSPRGLQLRMHELGMASE
jgi:DNA-binding NtrC family response regulator